MSAKLSFYSLGLVLGLITAIGPFAIDMYLPALPTITEQFATDAGHAQLTLSVFFLAMAISPIFYGTLSDMYGRKPPLLVGLGIFTFSTLLCIFVQEMDHFIALRLFQGIGAAAASVITYAIVRDFYTGIQATKLISLLMLVFSISPILAPIVGSFILEFTHNNWRVIFLVITMAASFGILLSLLYVPESLPPEKRQRNTLKHMLASYVQLIRDPAVVGPSLVGSFNMACFFCFLSASSFVLQGFYQLSPKQYALLFALNAIVFFASALLNGFLSKRLGLSNVVRLGMLWSCFFLGLLWVYLGFLGHHLTIFITLLMLGSMGMAWTIPTTTVIAMEKYAHLAGSTSSLIGAIQMLCGSIATFIMKIYNDNDPATMVHIMLMWILLALVMMCLVIRKSVLNRHKTITDTPHSIS